ncbi:copper chaperone PCu(A)C [Melioribacter sp. Ez-97]|uniref:copper chaperone PCu(A)C n=1 Tax=Melioribacter sp. Ez-97 TaxID=3423434 RepID=UPI003ED9CA2E
MKKLLLLTIFLPVLLYGQQTKIKVENAWARPAAMGHNSALYMTITNTGDSEDTLYAAKSSAAQIVEIHETYKAGDDMMGMREVEFVKISPGSSVSFKPGGHHIMLIGSTKDLKAGDSIKVELFFRKNGKIITEAKVKTF